MTTKKLDEIRRRNAAGENDPMIAEALNIPVCIVRYWRKTLGLPVTGTVRHKCTKQVIYTVWNAATDELLACGTSRECANLMGFKSAATFRQMVCRALQGENQKYHVEKAVETYER